MRCQICVPAALKFHNPPPLNHSFDATLPSRLSSKLTWEFESSQVGLNRAPDQLEVGNEMAAGGVSPCCERIAVELRLPAAQSRKATGGRSRSRSRRHYLAATALLTFDLARRAPGNLHPPVIFRFICAAHLNMWALGSFTFWLSPIQPLDYSFSKLNSRVRFFNEIIHRLDIWRSGEEEGGEEEEEEEEEDHLELPSPNVGICCNIPGGIFCHQLNSCCRIPAHVDEETGVVHISHPSSSPL